MQRFPCPWCGPRDESEFRYGGDAGKRRPEAAVSDGEWARYRFFRKNLKGPARELWVHAGGCGRWLVIERDTLSHTVLASAAAAP